MPDILTVTYDGTAIHTSGASETFTLNTAGAYTDNDIVIASTSEVDNLTVRYDGSNIVNAVSGARTHTLNTAGKYLLGDITVSVVKTSGGGGELTDLTGTKWTIKNSPNWTGFPGQSFSSYYFVELYASEWQEVADRYTDEYGSTYGTFYVLGMGNESGAGEPYVFITSTLGTTVYGQLSTMPTFTVTGGPAATDATFISWLQTNATRVS